MDKKMKQPTITWIESKDNDKDDRSIYCDRPLTVGEAIEFLSRLPKNMPMFVGDDYDTPPLNLNSLSIKRADDYEFDPEDGMDGKEFCAVNG